MSLIIPKSNGGERMSFIALYERIAERMEELVNDGKNEREARAMAWEEYHEEIF